MEMHTRTLTQPKIQEFWGEFLNMTKVCTNKVDDEGEATVGNLCFTCLYNFLFFLFF